MHVIVYIFTSQRQRMSEEVQWQLILEHYYFFLPKRRINVLGGTRLATGEEQRADEKRGVGNSSAHVPGGWREHRCSPGRNLPAWNSTSSGIYPVGTRMRSAPRSQAVLAIYLDAPIVRWWGWGWSRWLGSWVADSAETFDVTSSVSGAIAI